uniref:Recep_L_domain domain-containing protein n=1 Tax=Caenorhabditis tropicalis TaxID=1561998 RepID=A0A1I7TR73_9PELO
MSLSELIMKLEKHGVHIIPNKEIINKHRDTKKDLDLEIHTYRLICLNQINCESCRMNSTVSMETVVLTIDGAPV